MCGLNGILSFAGAPVDVREIETMRDCMAHRGPDGAGSWIAPDGIVGLGHRRLSIIDLSSTAGQPMANEDGTVQVAFNGEIYNHAELRAELERLGGHRWRTDHSDTEVIVHAYQTWGIDCVDRFRGMFAIALWDARARRLWLVRDRLGVKPLYYVRTPRRLAFASEIKALLTLPDVPRRVNEEALYHYLSFLATPAPLTMFEGIEKLPAATRLSVDASGSFRTERYWDPWEHTTPLTGIGEREIAERLRAELRTAVRYRAVSDVPVGIFLSGGIDSSTNAAMFSDGGAPVRTFSIGYDAPYESCRDELDDARRMAALLHADHHEQRLGPHDMMSVLDAVVYHQDEPIADVVCVPLFYLAKLAHMSDVTVCQVGEGSDELFCGYPFWRNHLRVDRLNSAAVPRMAKRTALGALAIAGRRSTYAFEVARRAASGEPTFWGGAEGLTHVEKQHLLGAGLRARVRGLSSAVVLEPIRRRFRELSWEATGLNWMTYVDLNLRLPELLLMRVDKMTMAASVEGRVPFLDHTLVELVLSIPTARKLGDGELKHILKVAVRGIIPDEVIDRRKQGFGVPLHEWMAGPLGKLLRDRITRFAESTGILDAQRLPAFLASTQWSKAWLLFNLAAWHARFIADAGV